MMTDIKGTIGQLFVIGFAGERPSQTFLDFLEDEHIGGVIFFEENCRTHELAKDNIATILSRYRRSTPLVAVDQEGGRVCRLKGAPAEYRAASEYAREDMLEQFTEDFRRAAVFLESIGVNLLLGPVCDIQLNAANRCLDGRCYGDTAVSVMGFVAQTVRLSRKAGLLTCLKHFPGLGDAAGDPHEGPVTAGYDASTWDTREKLPFAAAIRNGADLIMTTHMRVPAIDGQLATGSSTIVESMIRKKLDFDGPVITDDLTMAGAHELGDFGQRAVTAFLAGHDLLLFGQDTDAAVEAYDFFLNAVEAGEIPSERLQASIARIRGLKIKLDSMVLR